MEEKRKNKRLDLDVNVQLERLDEDGVTTLKFVHVDVTDISKSGIGFDCKKKLEMKSYYDAKIQIWTKEVVDAVIQIVRSEEKPDGFHYGGVFIGMTVMYSLANPAHSLNLDNRSSAMRQPRTVPSRTVIRETMTVVCVPRRKYW